MLKSDMLKFDSEALVWLVKKQFFNADFSTKSNPRCYHLNWARIKLITGLDGLIMDISEQEANKIFQDMLSEALAFAIVTKDGAVAYSYADNGMISHDVSDAVEVISTIANLSKKKAVDK